jgi:hypothetical protein
MIMQTACPAQTEPLNLGESTPHDLLEARIAATDWRPFEYALTRDGFAVLPALLTPRQCREIASYFTQEDRFRSRIVMERYAFGRGEYKYFGDPLPDVVRRLRESL